MIGPSRRRSPRMKGYDYIQPGGYFVTAVTQYRAHLFGEFVSSTNPGEMVLTLNELGKIVEFTWQDLVNHNTGLELDAFVVMPNHIHGIILLNSPGLVGEGFEPSPTKPRDYGLPEIVRQLKTFSARRIDQFRQTPGLPVWQRGYYDHILRDETDWDRILRYIEDNPRRWAEDEENRSS